VDNTNARKDEKPEQVDKPEPIVIRKLDKIETTTMSSNPTG
jgi:hypothetical protein